MKNFKILNNSAQGVKYVWNSPTFTTWANLGTNSLGLIVILPLIFTQFNADEITVYYLFASVIGMQGLLNLGFQPTFVRLIGFALAGRKVNDMSDLSKVDGECFISELGKEESIEKICSSMRRVNQYLAFLSLVVFGVIGTLALVRPIMRIEETNNAWIAWVVIVLATFLQVYNGGYSAYLRGANYVALSQRWGALFSFGRVISMIIVLSVAPGLLLLIAVNQIWNIFTVLRSWQLCRWVTQGNFKRWSLGPHDRSVFRLAWSRSWRSAVGEFGGRATQESLGFLYAQGPGGPMVATYLLGIRLIKFVDNFSMVPLYSKLPLLNQLRSSGNLVLLERIAKRGFVLSYLTYVFLFVAIAVFGRLLFSKIDVNAGFPEITLWSILGLTFIIHRIGANHIQLYTTTNHVIWHWANGIQGLVTIALSIFLPDLFPGGLGYALAILGGCCVYATIAVRYSHKILTEVFWRFEFQTSFLPLIVFCSFIVIDAKLELGEFLIRFLN